MQYFHSHSATFLFIKSDEKDISLVITSSQPLQ